jgi:hypothetical protein
MRPFLGTSRSKKLVEYKSQNNVIAKKTYGSAIDLQQDYNENMFRGAVSILRSYKT